VGPELGIGLLGPLAVTRGGEAVHVAAGRQRSILALLALSAGEVVSVDRIVDGVWGESQPEDAPAALQTQISRLRALLGTEAIVTRAPGYLLDVARENVDAHREEALTADAHRALARGDASEARRLATEALGLWRGQALADAADAPFAAGAQRELEERRLDAAETLVAAQLELGEHADVIGELRSMVAQHPYRERAWEQLMVALYRAGRQSDALDAYAEARRLLASELGLEPGPGLQALQAQILAHDPALAAPRRRRAPGPRPRPRRGSRRPAAFVSAALGAAAIVVVVLLVTGHRHERSPAATGAIVRLDARSGAARERVAVGREPGPIAVGAGAVWALDLDAETITRIRSGEQPETFATGAPVIDVAAGDQLFVGTGARPSDTQITGPVANAVQRVEPATRAVRATIDLPPGATVHRPPERQLALVGRDVWSVAADGSVVRIARGERIDARVRGIVATAIASGRAGLWVIGEDGTVARLDPRTARVSAQTRLSATSTGSVAVGARDVWVSAPADGTVWRIPAGRPEDARPIRLARGVDAVAVGGGAVWAANPLAGTVTRLDEERGRVSRTISVGGQPRGLAATADSVWVSVAAPRAPAAGDDPSANVALAPAVCEPAYVPRATRPDVLLVSDLPLHGGIRVSTTNMTAAIALTVRRRGFRAGRFTVGYVSCDDSTARTGIFDAARCATNARAYVRAPRVLGIVGALNSPCTRAAIGELARAGGRAPAMVSPLSSDPALTSGRASPAFARVFPSDDLQAAALAIVARRIGARRVYVLDSGDPAYGAVLADAFVRAAARVGVRVVGSGSWDPRAPARAAPIRAAARASPDAVVLAGTIDDGGITVLHAVRRAVGRGGAILLSDGFTPTAVLARRAGRDAEGAYVSVAGATLDALTPSGRAFGRELAATAPGAETDPASYYAAQAAEVLLDAVARSDGTRASVRRAVRATRLRVGLLGPIAFDRRGDISAPPISVLHIRVGDRSRTDFPSATLAQVLRPSRALVAP
jgi:DNA-binding SARP family transcriptional activator/ABC-type branched-subunit amino acid transport system substrate-binding protein